jgi:protein-disulfide isomerase
MRKTLKLLAGGLAFASLGALPSMAQQQQQERPNWNLTVEEKEGGHLFGNPEAEAKVTEYVSYTCGHCASFARQGDPALKLLYIPTGKVSVEVRHIIRDPIDWTVATLAHCGGPDKFALNHSAFMITQADWLGKAQKSTPAQQQRWANTDRSAARRAIASDLDFYGVMEKRGYSRTEIDRCLSDDAAAIELVKQSNGEAQRLGIQGTPSFAMNGKVLEKVHSWPALKSQIDAQLAAKTSSKEGN